MRRVSRKDRAGHHYPGRKDHYLRYFGTNVGCPGSNRQLFDHIGFELAAAHHSLPGFTRVTGIGRSDIMAEDIAPLVEKYDAMAADWESGAIAWVAKKNNQRLLILRGVSDLVGGEGGRYMVIMKCS